MIKVLPLRIACVRICIKNYNVTTLIIRLPQTISNALIIKKFLKYCTTNKIGIDFENHLMNNNLKQLYTILYKNIDFDYTYNR